MRVAHLALVPIVKDNTIVSYFGNYQDVPPASFYMVLLDHLRSGEYT